MTSACPEIIDDIEDLLSAQEIEPKTRYSHRKNVTIRVKKKKNELAETTTSMPIQCDSVIPGTQTIYVKTWGCTHNTSDSEYMAGQLQQFGYKITGLCKRRYNASLIYSRRIKDEPWNTLILDRKYDADLWLLNSCTVKNPAEDHFRYNLQVSVTHSNRQMILRPNQLFQE